MLQKLKNACAQELVCNATRHPVCSSSFCLHQISWSNLGSLDDWRKKHSWWLPRQKWSGSMAGMLVIAATCDHHVLGWELEAQQWLWHHCSWWSLGFWFPSSWLHVKQVAAKPKMKCLQCHSVARHGCHIITNAVPCGSKIAKAIPLVMPCGKWFYHNILYRNRWKLRFYNPC